MSRSFVFKIMFFFLLCSSCSVPETKIYSLYYEDLQDNLRAQNSNAIAFLSVKSQRHLEQPYIVFKSSPYELTPSSYAKWDASPTEMLKEKISENLLKKGTFKEIRTNRAMRTGNAYLIFIKLKDLSRLDTAPFSYGLLSFSVSLKDNLGKEIYARDFYKKERLEDRSYLSLAKGLSYALKTAMVELTEDIDKTIKGQGVK